MGEKKENAPSARSIFSGYAQQAKMEEKPEVSVTPNNNMGSSRVEVESSVPPWIEKLRKNKK